MCSQVKIGPVVGEIFGEIRPLFAISSEEVHFITLVVISRVTGPIFIIFAQI